MNFRIRQIQERPALWELAVYRDKDPLQVISLHDSEGDALARMQRLVSGPPWVPPPAKFYDERGQAMARPDNALIAAPG